MLAGGVAYRFGVKIGECGQVEVQGARQRGYREERWRCDTSGLDLAQRLSGNSRCIRDFSQTPGASCRTDQQAESTTSVTLARGQYRSVHERDNNTGITIPAAGVVMDPASRPKGQIMLFTIDERTDIRDELIAQARSDSQVIGAALVGSAARGREDRWSDIDLALQLAPDAGAAEAAERWTKLIMDRHPVADTMDMFGPDNTLFRVILLESSLQIDLSFWSHHAFRATAEGFQLIFGTPGAPTGFVGPSAERLIHMGWLYALHVRSAVARCRTWQAIMMLDDLRNQLVGLISLRNGLPAYHGRGVDDLPPESIARLEKSRARSTSSVELTRSARELLQLYVNEIGLHDHAKADTLARVVAILSQSAIQDVRPDIGTTSVRRSESAGWSPRD